MFGQHPADPPADAWAFGKHHEDLPRDYRRNAPETISRLPYADRVPAMAQRDRARREAFLDAYRIAPAQRQGYSHRKDYAWAGVVVFVTTIIIAGLL